MKNRIHARRGTKFVAVAAVALSLVLTSCSPPANNDAAGGGSGGGSLTIGMVGSTGDTTNPYQFQGSTSSSAMFRQVYEGLTQRDNDGAVIYVLAESIEPNETNDVWTVKLREGVKLQNGEEFIADDVAESLRWMIDPENAFTYATQVDWLKSADDIVVVDDHTLTLNLQEPFGLVPEMLAMGSIYMRSVRDGGTLEKPWGTGPFVLDSFTAGQEAKLTRNDDYWGDKANIEKLTIAYFTEQNAVTNAIRGGQIDVAQGIPFPEMPALEGDPNLELLLSDTAAYPIIAMNMQETPFDEIKVRQALRMSIDRERVVANAFGGFATVANDFIGKNTSCTPPDVPQREQDIDGAKALLAEAGAEGVEVELVTDGAFPGMMEMAQLVADDAAKAGINVSVRKLDVGSFLDRWLEWPFFISFTSSPYETTAKGHYLPGGSENGTWFDDPEYTELANQLYLTTDTTEQCALIEQMQTIEYERGGYLIPVYGQNITVHRSNVQGLEPDLYGRSAYMVTDVTVD